MSLDFSNEKIGVQKWYVTSSYDVVIAWREGPSCVHVVDIRGGKYVVGLDGKVENSHVQPHAKDLVSSVSDMFEAIGSKCSKAASQPPEVAEVAKVAEVSPIAGINPTDLFVMTETCRPWDKDTIVSGAQLIGAHEEHRLCRQIQHYIRRIPYRPFNDKKEFLSFAHEFFESYDGSHAYPVSSVKEHGFVSGDGHYSWLDAASCLRFARTGEPCAVKLEVR